MRVFGLKNCDSCRKALKEIRAAGLTPEVIDVRADGVEATDLAMMWAALGTPLLNTRSTTWRGLSQSERESDPLALIKTHPTLMKRPVIEQNGSYYLGWNANTRAALLG